MIIEDRLKALRQDYSQREAMRVLNAFRAEGDHSKADPWYWLWNALAFDWHGSPPWYAIASFKYAERLRGSTTT
jgi:hypothetical protein